MTVRAVPERDVVRGGLPGRIRRAVLATGNVVARRKGATLPGEDDGARGRVVLGLVEGPVKLVLKLVRQRVQRLRTIEHDDGHRLVNVVADVPIIHGLLPPTAAGADQADGHRLRKSNASAVDGWPPGVDQPVISTALLARDTTTTS